MGHEVVFYSIAEDTKPMVAMVETSAVHAGFLSPVDDAYKSHPIDLNKELVRNPATSYIVRVVGDSMVDEHINNGDLLVVDRSLFPTETNVAVCMVDGEFALKHIVQRDGKVILRAGNKKYDPIELANPTDLRVFGVVTWVLKSKF